MTTLEISAHRPADLAWLRTELNPETIRNITCLHICLNCPSRPDVTAADAFRNLLDNASSQSRISTGPNSETLNCFCALCPRSKGRGFYCFCPCLPQDNAPLDSEDQRDYELLQEWHKLAELLAADVEDRQLSLVLYCDTINKTTAEKVAEPLLAAFATNQERRLKQCTLRLGAKPDDVLTAFARKVSDQLTGRAILTRSASSDLISSKLPTKILQKIVDETLLTDEADNSVDRFRVFNSRWVNTAPDQYTCCKTCNSHTYSYSKCCCSKKTASYSPTCTCFLTTKAPLLVNKRFREIGQQVNCHKRAVFEMPFGSETLHYLRQIPPSLLPYIRHLCFVLDCSCFDEWREQSEHSVILQARQRGSNVEDVPDALILEDASYWPQILPFIRENFNISSLTISIYTTNEAKKYCGCLERENDEEHGQGATTSSELQDVFDTYWGTMKAFQKLMPDLYGLQFENMWWSKLESRMAEGVLGDKHVGKQKRLPLSRFSSKDVNDGAVPRWWYERESEDDGLQRNPKRRQLSADSEGLSESM